LYRRLSPYEDPLAFVAEDATFATLRDGYAADMDLARSLRAELETAAHAVYVLPPKPWARRVGGALANELARSAPGRAHALLTRLTAGGFLVSVRAPLDRPHGADELCRQFATGGGRKAAAGIDRLSEGDYDRFASAFLAAFG